MTVVEANRKFVPLVTTEGCTTAIVNSTISVRELLDRTGLDKGTASMEETNTIRVTSTNISIHRPLDFFIRYKAQHIGAPLLQPYEYRQLPRQQKMRTHCVECVHPVPYRRMQRMMGRVQQLLSAWEQ
ncbi:hypothetical protein RJ639_020020 [Escallonia herrerae]|uniref:Uncharacterized protein n=1 Tax=Escallonia herrerae TaxID=1293975 RepID=A0AA89AH15_9ASTE|nr:hypothetical protein RJ639_020020 [Escallonia herrerae]